MRVQELHIIAASLMHRGLANEKIRDSENLTHVVSALRYCSDIDEVIIEFECADLVYQPSKAIKCDCSTR